MTSVQEIGQEIRAEHPHPLQDIDLSEFCAEIRQWAEFYDYKVSEQEVLGIAVWTGFNAFDDDEILDAWRNGE